MSSDNDTIKQRLHGIQQTIKTIKPLFKGGSIIEPRMIAVSKKQPEERINEALNAGIRVFGESRVQEAYSRWHQRRTYYPDIELHMLGPLQSNKVKEAVALFDVIHSLDREKIGRTLSREMAEQNRSLHCFIQVNTGDESQKSGIKPSDLGDFLHYCRAERALNIIGLMSIPPIDEVPSFHFALLAKLARKLGLKRLSMGMSNDYQTALRHGATDIRLGTTLFGSRFL